jgi:AraC-like DNA-binding protein
MKPIIEKQITLPKVSIQLATVFLGAVEQYSDDLKGYSICQRLSENHAPLRIGNVPAREAFQHVRSIGFLPPGCPIRLYPVDAPFRVLNCNFESRHFEAITKIRQSLWDEHAPALVSIRNRRLEVLMQEIYAELVQPGFAHGLLIEATSNLILVEMARFGHQLGQARVRNGAGQGLAPWQMRRIEERIQASLEIGYPSLNELSRICGLSQSHLMRSFKISTGWQIHKYIAEERLRAAKSMLSHGQFNSKEISARLGFRSPAYFATAFRRMTGKTPTEFRREASAYGMH